MLQLIGNNTPPGGARAVLGIAHAAKAGAILVVNPGAPQWTAVLDRVLAHRRLGGVALYEVQPPPSTCPRA